MDARRGHRYTDDELVAIEQAAGSRDRGRLLDAIWDPIILAHHGVSMAEMDRVDVTDYVLDPDQHSQVGRWVTQAHPMLWLDVGPSERRDDDHG